jgi:hypothetical protein
MAIGVLHPLWSPLYSFRLQFFCYYVLQLRQGIFILSCRLLLILKLIVLLKYLYFCLHFYFVLFLNYPDFWSLCTTSLRTYWYYISQQISFFPIFFCLFVFFCLLFFVCFCLFLFVFCIGSIPVDSL